MFEFVYRSHLQDFKIRYLKSKFDNFTGLGLKILAENTLQRKHRLTAKRQYRIITCNFKSPRTVVADQISPSSLLAPTMLSDIL